MRIAGGITRLNLEEHHCDLLVCLYECVLEKQGQMSLRDVAEIEEGVQDRKRFRNTQRLLDEVSKKVS